MAAGGSGGGGGGMFCMGDGMVMGNGFGVAFGDGAMCALFLFKGAALDTPAKYALAVVGTLLLAMCVELVRLVRSQLKTRPRAPLVRDAVHALLFAVQMTCAYWLMLVAMLYEAVLFTALVLGLALGHLVSRVVIRRLEPPTGVVPINGAPTERSPLTDAACSPCCGDD
mmetsp:Transcript_40881/g.100557  ORF Transcript_40881/g.100557 Transcript_40881/m.100557 type:complete len:169 (-) Transcript_40881:65-571(-)